MTNQGPIVNKTALKQIIKQFEASKKRIGKERDALRELVYEIESIDDSCSEAELGLENVIDSLSQYL